MTCPYKNHVFSCQQCISYSFAQSWAKFSFMRPRAANTPLLCRFTAALMVHLPLGVGEGKCCCSCLFLVLLKGEP